MMKRKIEGIDSSEAALIDKCMDFEPQKSADEALTEIEKMELVGWSHAEWHSFLQSHCIAVSKRNKTNLPMHEEMPALNTIGMEIVNWLDGSGSLQLVSSELHEQTLLMHWKSKKQQPLSGDEGWPAWHGTHLPFLRSILKTGRLRSGTSLPLGVYCYKEILKHKAWGYAPAFLVHPHGVWMQVAVLVSAAGQWKGQPPKTIRKDQWLTQEAVVAGLVCKLMATRSLSPGDDYIVDMRKLFSSSTPSPACPTELNAPPEPNAITQPTPAKDKEDVDAMEDEQEEAEAARGPGQRRRIWSSATKRTEISASSTWSALEEVPTAQACTMTTHHEDVQGEYELREFLMKVGWGETKAYWLSSWKDYKGPRSTQKMSNFLEACKSIKRFVGEDGRDTICLETFLSRKD